MGFGAWGLGFQDHSFRCRSSGFGFRVAGPWVRVSGSAFRDHGFELGVWDLGFEVWELGFTISGFGFTISGFGFRHQEFRRLKSGELGPSRGGEVAVAEGVGLWSRAVGGRLPTVAQFGKPLDLRTTSLQKCEAVARMARI